MLVDVVSEVVIDRPVDVVSAYAGDPGNAPAWYANIASVDWETPPPLALGSRLAFVAHFLGRRLAYTYEVVVLSDRRLVMRTAQGPFPMETTYAWEQVGDGRTRMSLRNRGEPSGFSRVAAPMMTRAMSRANAKDLARLKALLESGTTAPR
ncbi:MAG: SRPBCC family protein [Lapillicoccus sp.]